MKAFTSLILAFAVCSCKREKVDSVHRVIYPFETIVTRPVATETILNEIMEPKSFIEWIDEHKPYLASEKQIGKLNFAVLYKPLDYMILSDIDSLNAETYLAKKKEYDNLQYYIFSIGLNSNEGDLLKSGLNTSLDYTQLIEYMSFELQHDLKLFDGNIELPCTLMHFERTFGLRPYVNFMVAFERTKNTDNAEKTLVYDDKLYKVGTVKLKIKKEAITSIPQLLHPTRDNIKVQLGKQIIN